MSGGQLWGTGMLRAAMVGAGGAVVAVAVSRGALRPVPARARRHGRTRPGSGRRRHACWPPARACSWPRCSSWPRHRHGGRSRRAGTTTPAARPSAVAAALAGAGVSPHGVVGVRLALEPGRGRTAMPVRATALAAVVAVAALASALTLGASLDHFLRTPRLYGWNWDVGIGDGAGPGLDGRIDRLLQGGPPSRGAVGRDHRPPGVRRWRPGARHDLGYPVGPRRRSPRR